MSKTYARDKNTKRENPSRGFRPANIIKLRKSFWPRNQLFSRIFWRGRKPKIKIRGFERRLELPLSPISKWRHSRGGKVGICPHPLLTAGRFPLGYTGWYPNGYGPVSKWIYEPVSSGVLYSYC